MDVYGTDVITCHIKKHPVDTSRNPILQQVPLAEPISDGQSSVDIDILVGSDYYDDIVKTERIPLEGGLLLLDSELGYILAGRTEAEAKSGVTMLTSLSRDQLPDSNFDLEKFWRLEDIGVHDPPEFCGDETALAEFNKTVVFDDTENRYQVKWPWKEEEPELSDNLKLSLGRLKSLLKRIEDKEEILEKYQSTIEDQVKLKIIEEAPKVPDGKVVHYIPHHGVVTPSKSTTKLRIVYDASCRPSKDSQSLTDCLYRGPVMLKDLCGLLIRFRLSSVGIVSDLEKAFLQIGLQAPVRDAARFLWVRDVRQPCSTQNLIHYRFRRLCFGVVSSPFLLAATVEHHLAKNDSEVARLISDNIYVDNVIVGKNSTEEAANFYKDAKAIFGKASMNLREIFSNDADFMESIPEIDRGKGCSTKVLGLVWDTKRDSLCVQVGGGFPGINSAPVTKRTVLRHIAQVFDPCGFLSPVTIVGKMLMQEVWKKKYDWDDALPDDLVKQWNNLHNELQQIAVVRIPRYIGESASLKAGRVDLHCFSDASSKAYCAVVYLRVVTESGFSVSLLFSKSRVAPVKTQTIPRLELLAAYIGVKLLNFVKTELRLPVARMVLWSDSQCALQWIRNSTVSTTFVKNRIRQIKEIPGIEFRYVPNADNPADYPTRGKTAQELSSCQQWWHGPAWLSTAEENWPSILLVPFEKGCEEASTTIVPTAEYFSVFDPGRVSSLNKILRIASFVLRFISRCRKSASCHATIPTVDEVDRARNLLIKESQRRHFGSFLDKHGRPKSNLAHQLGLFVDNSGIIRCSGRIHHSDLSYDAKFLILLPKHDPFSKLVVLDGHNRLHHAGVKQTLAELRYRYWIVRGRSEVKRILASCHVCKYLKGGPFRVPPEPPLPSFRVRGQRPFACVGVDYLGPLWVYMGPADAKKIWICLFTCAVTRAVHLEVVESMSAGHFLLCFRRFNAAYGYPELMVSDNAKTFVSSEKALRRMWTELLNSEEVAQFSAVTGIQWKFIVEMAPWMGGFYERMVGIVKNSLKAALNRKRVSLVQLQTIVAECATIVNSRPLGFSENEVGDFPLTPAHLTMRHHSVAVLPPTDEEEEFVGSPSPTDTLIEGWKRGQKLVAGFWDSWRHHYLAGLRERHHHMSQRNVDAKLPRPGMLVLIQEKNLSRGRWSMGRIAELIDSADGIVRAAVVKILGGKTVRRPIKLLYPIETTEIRLLSADGLVKDGKSENGGSVKAQIPPISDPEPRNDGGRKLIRVAAVSAKTKISDCIRQEQESD